MSHRDTENETEHMQSGIKRWRVGQRMGKQAGQRETKMRQRLIDMSLTSEPTGAGPGT